MAIHAGQFAVWNQRCLLTASARWSWYQRHAIATSPHTRRRGKEKVERETSRIRMPASKPTQS
jgi:hypothetical protein